MEKNAETVHLNCIATLPPRQVVGEGSVLSAIDHRGSHAAELCIADELLTIGGGTHESGHLGADGAVASLGRLVDVADLEFQTIPVAAEVATPAHAHLLYTGMESTLM